MQIGASLKTKPKDANGAINNEEFIPRALKWRKSETATEMEEESVNCWKVLTSRLYCPSSSSPLLRNRTLVVLYPSVIYYLFIKVIWF